jgi:hypothetical protein
LALSRDLQKLIENAEGGLYDASRNRTEKT